MSWTTLGAFLMMGLILGTLLAQCAGTGEDVSKVGATYELVDSGGLCGKYVKYDGGRHIIRAESDGHLYSASVVVAVESCAK